MTTLHLLADARGYSYRPRGLFYPEEPVHGLLAFHRCLPRMTGP
jgi:hypothetical protein